MAIKSAFTSIPKKVIIAPLNWGLGHATRCIPIIQYLLKQDTQVILASDGNALAFLEKEFPKLKSYTLPSYDISYKQKKIEHSMLLQSPKIAKAILAEKEAVKKIAEIEKPDLIISDNRLGLKVKQIKSVYITHQLKLLSNSNMFSKLGTKIHQSYIEGFDECWIPDIEGSVLSGEMSNLAIQIPKRYLGCLSRMEKDVRAEEKVYHSIAILSGPEPQRTQLENILIDVFSDREEKTLLVRGIVERKNQTQKKGNLDIMNFLLSKELQLAIAQSKHIICRSGYSSIMDLEVLERKAILIPTPGQTEQEYLAERSSASGKHSCIPQNRLKERLPDLLDNL